MKIKIKLQPKAGAERTNVSEIVLAVIKTAGIISIAMVAPNALKMLELFEGDKRRKKNPKYQITSVLNRLKKQKYVEVFKKKGRLQVRLTRTGELRLIQSGSAEIKRPMRWDGKWRVVIFDISEKRKQVREQVRQFLENTGFYRVQDSVWVHAFDCEEFIAILKIDFEIRDDLIYILAENIENDLYLRERFGV